MRATRKIEVGIGAWFLGFVMAIWASCLLAWLWDRWQTHRLGIGIGLLVIAIVFWGSVVGAFLVGPVAAVVAIKRAGRGLAPIHRPGRSQALVAAAILGSTVLVVGGGIGVCLARGWTPCRGLPAHDAIGRGDFRYVLPSPDGSRYAFVAGYLDHTQVGLLDPEASAFGSPVPFALPQGVAPIEAVWMPDSRRLLVTLRGADGRDEVGILSTQTGRIEATYALPFTVADHGGPAVDPDGTSALVFAADRLDTFGNLLYRLDLRSGDVDALIPRFPDGARSPLYLDADHAVVVQRRFGYTGLTLLDLRSGGSRGLTPSDIDVFEVAGRDADNGLVFVGFHVTPDPYVRTIEDQEDPFVGDVDLDTGYLKELYEPGVTRAIRMFSDGDRAVVLAETCSFDCGADLEVWTLDLSRYLSSDAGTS